MRILLLFVSLLFSFIFFSFYLLSNGKNLFLENIGIKFSLESISGNLIFETILFLMIGFTLFFYFYESDKNKKIKKSLSIDYDLLLKYILSFFKNYVYYIGLVLFYIGLYLVLNNLGFSNFSYIIFIINLVVIVLFFIRSKLFVFRDFIKINIIIFSLYYIYYYLIFFITGNNYFQVLDLVNGFVLLLFFLISFYTDRNILEKKESDRGLVFYFFFYLFLFVSFYLSNLITNLSILFNFLGFLFSFYIFFFVLKISFFKNNKKVLKGIGLIFLYVSQIFGIYYLFNNDFNLIVVSTLVYGIIFNYKIHNKYQNYVSLILCATSFIFLLYYSFFNYVGVIYGKENLFIIFSIFMSLFFLLFTYFKSLNFRGDYYFYHIIGYLINIFSVVYYFYILEFEIFNFGIILLFNSFYIILSYSKLKNID